MSEVTATAAKPALLDLDDLNARAACDVPFKFEYLLPDGKDSGLILHVLGDQSETVTSAINTAINARRKKDAVAAARAARTRPDHVEVTPIEDDIAFGQRLAALRIVGWDGAKQSYSPELALTLCQRNPDLAKQVLEAAGELGNFMKVSPRA